METSIIKPVNMHSGELIAEVLKAHGVKFIFTLCGGHISPILTGCKSRDIRVIDVRHEATAVFAADAVSRLSGIPGVAVVTAGPGVTNTITAVKNAQLAQSALLLLGGATATALKGRGALQDIDQMALMKPHVKWATSVRRLREMVPVLTKAFKVARDGVPGPVFVECPVDLLYDELLVREWYGLKSGTGKSLPDKLLKLYLERHVNRLFAGKGKIEILAPAEFKTYKIADSRIGKAAHKLKRAKRPVLLIGSQSVIATKKVEEIAAAVGTLGIPVYLTGMARGLLGKAHPLQLRHQRRMALKDADMVVLAGVPFDFRLDYGRQIRRKTFLISVNRNRKDLKKNRRPQIAIHGDPGLFLIQLADKIDKARNWIDWLKTLRSRDEDREQEIATQCEAKYNLINPIKLCSVIENSLPQNSIVITDGGDFVAMAAYILNPRAPLCWLDPGAFGTLGVGAGFALGAKLCRPGAEIWVIYGDGSVGYSVTEFDTFVRHSIPVLAIIGNDACWSQIAREQVEILKDDVATVLNYSDYHLVAEALGAQGFILEKEKDIELILSQATGCIKKGYPVLINARIAKTDFRKGSISM